MSTGILFQNSIAENIKKGLKDSVITMLRQDKHAIENSRFTRSEILSSLEFTKNNI